MKQLINFSLLFCVLLVLGCNNRVEVNGKVSFDDGQPFEKGVVCFIAAEGEYSVSGPIQKDGSYKLVEMPANKKGIKPGDYKVVIGSTAETYIVKDSSGDKLRARETIDSNYVEKAKTPLSVKVDKKMTYDIQVPRMKK